MEEVAQKLYKKYKAETPDRVKLLDLYALFLAIIGTKVSLDRNMCDHDLFARTTNESECLQIVHGANDCGLFGRKFVSARRVYMLSRIAYKRGACVGCKKVRKKGRRRIQK
ncbi:unnamed protein product [Amoebophrya sp. A25]|nr:unnamed protein product [Amoebophrya sp. A25]|eukprot:GSA25T00011410001.1